MRSEWRTHVIRAAVRTAEANGEAEVKVTLTEQYLRNAGHVARERAVVAGVRLGAVLSAALRDDASPRD